MDSDNKLPEEIIRKASLRGNEFAWKEEDVIEAIILAKENKFASIGGQVQFRLPDVTCELYWLNFDSEEKFENESWTEYVIRSAEEVITEFKRICLEYNFIKEGYESFDILKYKVDTEGANLKDYLCFVIYFNDEYTYYTIPGWKNKK